jgi:hypothetical protein
MCISQPRKCYVARIRQGFGDVAAGGIMNVIVTIRPSPGATVISTNATSTDTYYKDWLWTARKSKH